MIVRYGERPGWSRQAHTQDASYLFTVCSTFKANEIAAFRFKFEIYFPYYAIRPWYELRYRENTVIFGLRDFSRESAIVSQRFAGCMDVTNCKQVIVHIFKNMNDN